MDDAIRRTRYMNTRLVCLNGVRTLLLGFLVSQTGLPVHAFQGFRAEPPVASSRTVQVGGGAIQIDFAAGTFDLGEDAVVSRIEDAAKAVSVYYGRFPVSRVRILVIPIADRHGVFQGTTWGNRRGFQGFTRVRIGEHTTQKELADDWMLTHELVHMGFPSLPDDQHWMEEGLATYVEPVARVQVGQLTAKSIWTDMVDGMPKGEPAEGDLGLDKTHTWGRTYWGGALFSLVADVTIRKETKNRKGLQDALRAIVAAGGTIDNDWPIEKALEVGDRATGTHVLSEMYMKWRASPVNVDLPALWKELGVKRVGDGVELDGKAPLAKVREGITAVR
jgi:hypothetical protein